MKNLLRFFANSWKIGEGKHLGKGSQRPKLPDDGKLRLYSMRFCPFAHRAHLVLAAKKVPFHVIYINLTEKPEWLTKVSAVGKVPALEIVSGSKTTTLIESLVICEYLDEKYPVNPLFPKDPLKKALDKILIERFSAVTAPMYKIFVDGRKTLADISSGLDIYEKELAERGTRFFNGGEPGMLDYMIWPWCERSDVIPFLVGDRYKLDEKRFANLVNWKKAMLEDVPVQSFYVEAANHLKYLESRKTGFPNYDLLA